MKNVEGIRIKKEKKEKMHNKKNVNKYIDVSQVKSGFPILSSNMKVPNTLAYPLFQITIGRLSVTTLLYIR